MQHQVFHFLQIYNFLLNLLVSSQHLLNLVANFQLFINFFCEFTTFYEQKGEIEVALNGKAVYSKKI